MWLKIKVWTKIVLFSLLSIYILIFLLKNTGRPVEFWYWFNHAPEMPVLVLVLAAFAVGVVGTILLRTTFTTLSQVRELQSRTRADRLHREMEVMKTKASMLRTRDTEGLTGTPSDTVL